MKTNRRMFRALALTAALATLTLVASAQTSIFQIVPTPDQNEFNNALYASSASSPNDIWAVGNITIHFDGKHWKDFPAPGAMDDSSHLSGVLTFSPTLAWAGGGGDDKGQIIDQWNGKKWERLQGLPFPPAYYPYVMTMSATSANDIWVTGSIDPLHENYQLFFEHWNGTFWETNNFLPGAVAWLYGASQDATNDAWAVGFFLVEDEYETPLAVHYNGSDWIVADLPFPQGAQNAQLQGVLALAPNNVWAVGWQNSAAPYYYTNTTLIYHFDGHSWTIVPSPDATGTSLMGIVANSANDMYAFGFSADPSGYGFDSLVVHWDGNEWTIIPSPNPRNNANYIQNDLLTGVVPSPGNVWIFGEQFDSPHGVCTDGNCTLAIHTTGGD